VKKVAKTYQSDSFKNGGSWQGAQSIEKPKTRIILVHSAQNLEDHPILKATKGKNIPNLTGLTKEEVEEKIQNQEPLSVNFEGFVKNKKNQEIRVNIQAEDLSMEEYLVFQRIYFEETGKHLDEIGWTWLLKSRLKASGLPAGSRVADAGWSPYDRQLFACANYPEDRYDDLGGRLSRSFSKS